MACLIKKKTKGKLTNWSSLEPQKLNPYLQSVMRFTFTPFGAQESLWSSMDEPRGYHFKLTWLVYITQVHIYPDLLFA